MKIIGLECPGCAAQIKPDLVVGIGICEYCGSRVLFDREDGSEEDVGALSGLKYLKSLNILQTEVEDLTPLMKLKNLKELHR